jgi:DNA polymerase-3 subunit delta'
VHPPNYHKRFHLSGTELSLPHISNLYLALPLRYRNPHRSDTRPCGARSNQVSSNQTKPAEHPAPATLHLQPKPETHSVPLPTFPTDFNEFLGNTAAVENLRTAIAAGRLPHAIILSGPAGAGKYTLALMLTMTIECARQPRDLWSNGQTLAGFCGHCANCVRIASAANLEEQVAAAVLAREDLRETDKKETRVLIQPHPDVLILPPDPPQLLIKLGQVRTLIQRAHFLPAEAPRRVFILTSASMMKEAANSLLKILEEPPESVHIFILAENIGELLPTIRSRCASVRLGALPIEEMEMLLADRRPELPAPQRALIARLSQGAVGRALAFDLDDYTAARTDALIFLQYAASATPNQGGARSTTSAQPDHTTLLKMTETYRAGAEGQQKTTALLRAFSLLLEDLLLLNAGTPELLRNTDLRAELDRLASTLPFEWIERASHAADQVQSGLRRNLLRSLSLDAFAAQLATLTP